jgi:catechol 2,3-dioxygenase-like lactoylglutathione lyase family enzyme
MRRCLRAGAARVNDSETPENRMKRFHVHVSVDDLETSIRFYRELFAAEPVVQKPDYAKWMLEDPRVNFAISQRERDAGIRHLGIQVSDREELAEVYGRLRRAEGPVREDGATTCCYAQSEKSWIADPQGVQWETFLTTGESTMYGVDEEQVSRSACCEPAAKSACCEPAKESATACCG